MDHNKLFEKNENNFTLQVLLELGAVFTMGLYTKLWEESREVKTVNLLLIFFFYSGLYFSLLSILITV